MTEAMLLLTDNHKLNLNYNCERTEFHLDAKLMKFVLNNLLSNAIKYSPEGGEVDLDLTMDNENLLLKVSDNGIGIPAEEIGKVYESFYRSKNAGVIPGSGLGLSIVKRAVDYHGGSISVQSELNKGTTFTVTIPIITQIMQD